MAAGRVGEVLAPTLVLWGEHEVAQFVSHGKRVAREVHGAQSAVLEGAGHMANMDAPAAFDAALLGSLASAWSRRSFTV